MMINPFKSSAFEMANLKATIDKMPYVPMGVTELGVFGSEGINLPTVLIDERQGVLTLANTTVRGGPAQQMAGETRNMRQAMCTHILLEDAVTTDDLLGIREFGSETAQAQIATLVNRKLANMKQSIVATVELMRVSALKGILVNAAGTTLYNLFTHFNVPQQPDVDFTLGTSTTDIRGVCMDVNKAMSQAMDNVPFAGAMGLCGWNFFKRLTGHADVKEQYKYWSSQNTQDQQKTGFTYGGITFVYYRGGPSYIDSNECRFFPMGGLAQSIFPTWYGPSTWMENAGEIGQPIYVKTILHPEGTGIRILVQSNPLPFCLRPTSLIRGKTSN